MGADTGTDLLEAGPRHWLLARHSITTGQIAYYVCYGPRRTRLVDLAQVAGARWAIEEWGLLHRQVTPELVSGGC